MSETTILCVDDEKNVLRSLERMFFEEDYKIITATSGEEGLEALRNEECQIIISDYRMPEMTGVEFLKEVRKKWPETIRIVLSGYADVASIVAAINEGEIYKFIPKPWNDDDLKVTVANAIERYYLGEEIRELNNQLVQQNMELERINVNLEEAVKEKVEDLWIQNRVLKLSQVILDLLPVGVVGISESGDIVQINECAQKIITRGENRSFLGESAEAVFKDEIMGLIKAAEEKSQARGSLKDFGQEGKAECIPFLIENEQKGFVLVLNPEDKDS